MLSILFTVHCSATMKVGREDGVGHNGVGYDGVGEGNFTKNIIKYFTHCIRALAKKKKQ